jgi:hypothetical protein
VRIFSSAIRFRPFSHLPGTHALLPGSFLSCQVFPARLVLFDYSCPEPEAITEIFLEGFGPLEQFTVIQDLEKGHLEVSGFCKDGFLRYQIIPLESPRSFALRFVKVPPKCPCFLSAHGRGEGKADIHETKEFYFLDNASREPKVIAERERLFLGCTKAQDWSLVSRRLDIKEILPIWYWLAQSIPKIEQTAVVPQLYRLAQAIREQKMHELPDFLLALFQVGFKDLLVPRLFDDSYLGFPSVEGNAQCSPLLLLQNSWELIRQCFFVELPHHFYILPLTPPQFHSGMLCRLLTSQGHSVTIEWTKQVVRRVWIEGGREEVITFAFQKHLKRFRLKSDEGVTQHSNFSEIALQKGKRFLLDHFEK